MCSLTFELSRRRRWDARPGLAKMYAYRQTGPGGLPLVLASSEGLGCTAYRSRAKKVIPHFANSAWR